MGLVVVVESVPYVVLGTAGRWVVARFSTFGRLAWVDAARGLVAVVLPFVWGPDARGVALLLVGVLLLGVLGALFDPNLGALVPDLVGPARVQQVTGLFDLTGRIARIAGPASIGLLLLPVSEVQFFALNGMTFAVSAVALGWLARRSVGAVAGGAAVGRSGKGRSAGRAWPTIRAYPRVGLAVGLHGVALFCSAVTAVGMPALLTTRYGAGAAVYGLVTAVVGAGAFLGNPLASDRRWGGWLGVYCGAWVVQGVATACMGLVLDLPALLLLALVTGLATPATSVTLRSHLGAFAPAERLRLMSVDQTVIRAGGTAGMLLPFLVDASPRGAFVVGGVTVAGAALGVLLVAARVLRPDALLPVPAGSQGAHGRRGAAGAGRALAPPRGADATGVEGFTGRPGPRATGAGWLRRRRLGPPLRRFEGGPVLNGHVLEGDVDVPVDAGVHGAEPGSTAVVEERAVVPGDAENDRPAAVPVARVGLGVGALPVPQHLFLGAGAQPVVAGAQVLDAPLDGRGVGAVVPAVAERDDRLTATSGGADVLAGEDADAGDRWGAGFEDGHGWCSSRWSVSGGALWVTSPTR